MGVPFEQQTYSSVPNKCVCVYVCVSRGGEGGLTKVSSINKWGVLIKGGSTKIYNIQNILLYDNILYYKYTNTKSKF